MLSSTKFGRKLNYVSNSLNYKLKNAKTQKNQNDFWCPENFKFSWK